MVSEQKKSNKIRRHNNDNINKRQKKKKGNCIFIRSFFLAKIRRIIKSPIFQSSLPMLGTKPRALLLFLRYHTLFFPKITVILSIVKDTVLY